MFQLIKMFLMQCRVRRNDKQLMQLKGAHINKLVIHSYGNLHLLLALWYVN